MDEEGRNVVVFDIGDDFVQYGSTEEYSPIYKFATIAGRLNKPEILGETIEFVEIKEIMVGEEVSKLQKKLGAKLDFLDISHLVKSGIVGNFDYFTLLMEQVFDLENMRINPKRSKIVLTESPETSAENREKLLEILFDKFGFHSVFFGNQAALSLFSKGITSGVVVHFHRSVTDISLVHLFPLKDYGKRLSSSDNSKISEIIFETIRAADPKVQLELFKRILLIGDSAPEPKTVEAEIKQLYLERALANDEEKFKIRVEKIPSENQLSFSGGALLGSMNKDQPAFWISKEDYKENGKHLVIMKLLAVVVVLVLIQISSGKTVVQPKIVNGTNAHIAEFPYLVSLQNNNYQSCAGSLLNDLWIVTAAHCLGGDPKDMSIEYATTTIANGYNGTKIAFVEKYIQHEEWDSPRIRNDIGLVKLQKPLDTGLQGSAVKLALPGKYYPTGTPTTVAGWGRIASGEPISTTLQKVDLQIYSYADCKAAHDLSGSSLDIYRTNICAGVPEMGKAECNGDSGGPLVVDGVQVGIVSWSIKPCAVAPYPGVYTDVSKYIDWITEHTGIKFEIGTFLIRKL